MLWSIPLRRLLIGRSALVCEQLSTFSASVICVSLPGCMLLCFFFSLAFSCLFSLEFDSCQVCYFCRLRRFILLSLLLVGYAFLQVSIFDFSRVGLTRDDIHDACAHFK